MKVASGGELARFLLALKVVLADRGSAPTLVFDEIDTGVGGAVADAIGVRLARLGARVQVVAVTHAPQVAARAGRHYLITKDALDKGKRVATRVVEVAAERRREEIARMLAGAEITEEARAAAEKADPCGGGRCRLPQLDHTTGGLPVAPPRSIVTFCRHERQNPALLPSSAGIPTTRCSTRSAPTCAGPGTGSCATPIAPRSRLRAIRWPASICCCVSRCFR